MEKRKTSQFRAWVFTINNYAESDLADVQSLTGFSDYLVCGKEVGQKGTPHLQGYVYMKKPCTRTSLSRVLKRGALFPSKGSDFDNFGYATKEETWLIHGVPPCQGKRVDLDNAMEFTTMREFVLNSTSYQAIRMAEKRLVYTEPQRRWKPLVIWVYGGTGVGKSRYIHDTYPDLFEPQSYKWWDGYDGHDVVLIDDIRADFCKFHEFLKLIDRYPFKVEVKGGMRQLRAKRMFFTSPYHPLSLYKGRTDEDLGQLNRRIDWIVLAEKDKYTIMKSPVLHDLHELDFSEGAART